MLVLNVGPTARFGNKNPNARTTKRICKIANAQYADAEKDNKLIGVLSDYDLNQADIPLNECLQYLAPSTLLFLLAKSV